MEAFLVNCLPFFNRNKFEKLAMKHQAERYSKGLGRWDQFVAMLFCQLAQAKSLREISGGLACCLGKLKHLGMDKAPGKSTLSYANKNRPWQMYRNLFYETYAWCRATTPAKHKFRFKNKLLSLSDASTISEIYKDRWQIELFFKAIKQNLKAQLQQPKGEEFSPIPQKGL